MAKPVQSTQSNSLNLRYDDRTTLPVAIPDFLTAEECRSVLELASTRQTHDAKVVSKAESLEYGRRKSTLRHVYPDEQSNWFFVKMQDLIMHCNKGFQYDIQGFLEGVQVATYDIGGHFDWHMDAGPGKLSIRKLSITIQMTPPEEYQGGELEFMGQDRLAPRDQGTAIVFPTFLFHRVRPVTKGSRVAAVTWVHGSPFR